MSNELKPKIRFKGFTDDWEQRKFEQFALYRNGKAHENDISDNGKYVVVNSKFCSTNGSIRKYSDKQNEPLLKNEIAFVLSDVPNGRALARTFLVDKSNKYTLNQRIAGITPLENTDPYYLFVLMNRNKYFLQFDDGAKQTNLSVSDIYKFSEMFPNKTEQENIGSVFNNLDNLITLHQRKCNKLIELKKSLLEKMFPQNNSIIPEIRFKGFTDDWEQRKLSTLIRKPITDGPHETPQLLTSGIPFISVEAIHDGIIDLKKCRGYISEYDDERFKQKYIPEIGDVFFTKAATIGRVAVVDKLGFNIWSPIGAIKPDFSKTISKYLYYVLQTDNIMKEALLGSNSSSQYNLSMDTIENFTINIPKSINEQVEVSKLLTNIDNLITLHQRKHDKLNKIKQSLLNDMFV